MRHWFLSYNSQDLALVQAFEEILRRKDAEAHIFFAPKSLRSGGYWLQQLADEIGRATGVILLVGEKGLGRWQFDEYCEARDRRIPVVLILLEGQPAPGLPMLRQLHWIVTAQPASEQTVAQVMASIQGEATQPHELWRHTAPYRGLAAMTEADTDFFFGRERETIEVIRALADAPDQLPVLLGNSGVGKSSLAQAGVLAAVARQAWPETAAATEAWPHAFGDSRRWCVLRLKPGTEPIRALVEAFLRTWQFDATDPRFENRLIEWVESLIEGRSTLRGLLDATERRSEELGQPKPPAFLLYVDQGEELYVRAEARQRLRFSEILAAALGDPRLRAFLSLRADFFGALQNDEPLYARHRLISVPPLREKELREVVSRPAMLLGARFETEHLANDIARRTAEESAKDAGALPLLSYLLDDMWMQMITRGDGQLRLPPAAMELGGVLAERANAFLATHPAAEEALKRILTLRLATVREDGEPTRRRASRSEFSDEEWLLVSELADHPNRLLVTATPEGGETYAEVAHEAIFRRWAKLRDWIAAEREFLAWKTGLEAARRVWWATPDRAKHDALLMGAALAQAQSWFAKRKEDLPAIDRTFIERSIERERRARTRKFYARALIYVLMVGVITGLIGWINQDYIKERKNWYMTMRPYMLANFQPHVLSAEAERALKPLQSFRECAKDCPEMVVIPAGEFMMGAAPSDKNQYNNESPQHKVTIGRPFAVSRYHVTFADWDACTAVGGCPHLNDSGYGRGRRPVINLTWNEAQEYVAWLSLITGKKYRLLTEAEWEYAARAGTTTPYYWGEEVGKDNANCNGCGSQWDNNETSPAGSFKPNPFGLFDMGGNVWQMLEDCYNRDYTGAPTDGSAWLEGDCSNRTVRGGSWSQNPRSIRPAGRNNYAVFGRDFGVGFRVGRTLGP